MVQGSQGILLRSAAGTWRASLWNVESNHAKKVEHGDCSTYDSFGIAGSKKAELCSQHAREGTVNVKKRKHGHEGCIIVVWGGSYEEDRTLQPAACEGGNGELGQQEMWPPRVQPKAVGRHGRYQER